MLYSDSWPEMMQNAVNESFWDAQGVEIEACANSEHFYRIRHFLGFRILGDIGACLNLDAMSVPEALT